jgi:hypothetical protein
MLNFNQDGLQIFDSFEIDTNLPKHGKQGSLNIETSSGNTFFSPSTRMRADGVRTRITVGGSGQSFEGGPNLHLVALEKDSFLEFLGRKLLKWGDKLTGKEPRQRYINAHQNLDGSFEMEKEQAPTLSVEEFFKSLKNSKRQLEKLDERIEAYEASLEQAKALGQVALAQDLQRKVEVVKSESQLYANNLVKVILEEQAVDFYKKSERGIRLDWIKNFTRTIPQKFVDTKARLDSLKIFDNYVIMHYDPDGVNTKMTDEEVEEAKKDPILFGVIAGSRKLYYIGDWVDEYCDLTLDAFIDEFGKDVINKNNITAEIDVNFGETTLAEPDAEETKEAVPEEA